MIGNTTASGRCLKTRFQRVILCAGTMTDWIEIKSRAIVGTEPGGSSQPTESFVDLLNIAGRLEVKKGVNRFAGVNTADQSESNFTHVIYVPYDETVYQLDLNTMFAKITRTRDRYFKMKLVTNVDEQDQWLEFEVSETGFADLEAAQG